MDNEIQPPNPEPPGTQPSNPQPSGAQPSNPPPPNPQPQPLGSPPPLGQDRTLDALCHFLAFSGLIIPFGNIFGPLVLWAIKKDENPSVNEHGKESINFQISMTIYTIIAGLSLLVVIGLVLLPAIFVLNIVLVIIAGVKATNGELYRYPMTIRFIK